MFEAGEDGEFGTNDDANKFNRCIPSCPPQGFWPDDTNKACQPCAEGALECTAADAATKCRPGLINNSGTCEACGEGKFWNRKPDPTAEGTFVEECADCDTNCKNCNIAAKHCTECKTGFAMIPGFNRCWDISDDPPVAPEGFKVVQGKLVIDDAADICPKDERDQTKNADEYKFCDKCAKVSTDNTDLITCIKCKGEALLSLFNPRGTCTPKCPLGSYRKGDSPVCKQCREGDLACEEKDKTLPDGTTVSEYRTLACRPDWFMHRGKDGKVDCVKRCGAN